MHTFGKVIIYLGIAMIALGLVVGFTGMAEHSGFATQWIGAVPWGFLMLLTGTVTTLFSPPPRKKK